MQTTDTLSQPKTMAAAAATMASYAMSRGVPIEEILTKLEINPLELMAPDSRVQEEVFPKIMNMMAASLPDEAFALDLAKMAPFSILGYVSSAIEFALTFRDGLEILVQYKSVLSDRLSLHYSILGEGTFVKVLLVEKSVYLIASSRISCNSSLGLRLDDVSLHFSRALNRRR